MLILPENYQPMLDPRETERAILKIKDFFQTNLALELNLTRVTAPLFVPSGTGINDDLNGREKPVSFAVKDLSGQTAEIVQSLAKWKRLALAQLGFEPGAGIYTDMNAIRPDETLDNTHSLYVDQWDWEHVISREERGLELLRNVVRSIYDVIRRTEKYVAHEYREIAPVLPATIQFVHTEELEQRWPELSPRERENAAAKEYGAVFIIGIGGALANGEPHDGRAPDYDDWTTPTEQGFKGLNGDIFVYNHILNMGFELSSMGIRVDADALLRQLEIREVMERKTLYFHHQLLNGKLPLSIGGGIGQSRLCMLYLRKAHIGEIQTGLWPQDMIDTCKAHRIHLL